jgi:Type I restriction modification DNA specificity domain
MTPHDLIVAFEDLADAPDGVKRLRELVLQLAIQGNLTDGNAETWRGATLGEILVDGPTNGWSPKAVEQPTGVMSLKLSATTKGYFDASQFKHVEPEGELDPRLWLEPGDLLVQRSNTPEYVGTAAVFDGPRRTFIYPDLMMRCRVSPEHDVRFVHLAISAPTARAWISAKASGTSKSMVKVNQAAVASIPVELPPLAEQHRIVARVDELMGLLDRLEAARTAREELRRAARDAALAALRDAEDTEAVEAAWGRIAREMDTLFAEPEDVGPLRQAVLHLAVRGRLIRQDQHDQPASHFLALVAEIKRSTGCGKSRRHTWDLIDSVPWALPDGWAWAPFGDTNINRDGERVPVSAEERQGRVGPYSYFGASGVICRWGSQSASDR